MRIIKKALAFFIVLALMFALLPVNAFAEDDITTIKIDDVKCRLGETTIDVPIKVSNNAGISGFLFGIIYDTNDLEVTSVSQGKDLPFGTLMDNLNDETRTSLHVMWYSAGEFNQNGEIVVLKVTVKNTQTGTYPLTVIYNEKDIRNSTSQIPVNILQGSVIVREAYMKGDFDDDESITVADALAALRIAAKLVPEDADNIAIGDVDADGHITVADALAILRVAAKLTEKL